MSTPVRAPIDQRRRLTQDARVKLYDLDYSRLAGFPGDPAYVFHFCDVAATYAERIALGGVPYVGIPLTFRGYRQNADGQQPRPGLQVAERTVAGILHTLALSASDLRGALLVRKHIYRRHLDDGDDPDPAAVEWPPERWIVSRKTSARRGLLQFELTSTADFEGVELPMGRLEHNFCMHVYGPLRDARDAPRCSWQRLAGPYFTADNAPTANPAEDDCGRDYAACKLRFGARGQPLDFGGFPSATRLATRSSVVV